MEEGAFLQSHIRDYEGTTIYYNGNKACLEALITNSNGQLDRPRLNEYGLVYRCNVNFRTQDGDLIKTVPVYSTMDVKQDDIPVDASGTASTWYLDEEVTGKTGEIPVGTLVTVSFDKDAFADSGLTFDHWDIKGLKDPTAYNTPDQFAPYAAVSTVDVTHAWKKAQSVKQG